jgi:integrase
VAKPTKAVRLDTKSERAKLPVSGTPYYVTVGDNLHLGYRKGKKGGVWVARRRVADRYVVETLAAADDAAPADGSATLSYPQAQDAARRWANVAPVNQSTEPITVGEAVTNYLRFLETHRKSPATARNRAKNDILPQLGHFRIDQLTTAQLRDWHTALAARPRMVWSGKGKPSRALPKSETDEAKRKRRSSANRVLGVLKSALNLAFRDHEKRCGATDKAWRNLAPFSGVDAARVGYLQRDECVRLIHAADEYFRPVANAALLTGCRYGELTRLVVGDFNADAGTLHVRQAKGGKRRHVILTDEGVAFFKALCAGKPGDALMLIRGPDGSSWKPSDQVHRMRKTCKNANLAPINFHALRHTYASHAIMDGVSLMVVARNLGHVDTKMVEKHYGHLSTDHVTQMIRERIRPFGTVEESNVVPFAKGAAS